MQRLFILFCISCVFKVILCAPADVSPCPKDDPQCLTKITRIMFKSVVTGNEALGIPSSDPLYRKLVEGIFENIKYSLSDYTLSGFSQCNIESVTADADSSAANFEMVCPLLNLVGKYTIDGEILGLPIKGSGDFSLAARDDHIDINAQLKRVAGKDGHEYLSFKNFKVNPKIRGGFTIDLQNLFDGDKAAGETANSFINENWELVAEQLQEPIFTANIKGLLENCNEYLKTIPIENLLKNK